MRPLIVANWKMNPVGLSQSLKLAKASDKRGVVLCPPFIFLSEIRKIIKNAELGAQDAFWEKEGPFTGEISPLALKKIGCRYVITGHSERRSVLGESDEVINRKIKSIVAEKMKPILCIGEAEKNERKKILKSQLRSAFRGLSLSDRSAVIVAYEPVWAIGTGNPCDPVSAEESRIFIEKILKKDYSVKKPTILYGGSVNPSNAANYLKKASFNGVLAGGSSLNPEKVGRMIEKVSA